jgi:hypothetical protein
VHLDLGEEDPRPGSWSSSRTLVVSDHCIINKRSTFPVPNHGVSNVSFDLCFYSNI